MSALSLGDTAAIAGPPEARGARYALARRPPTRGLAFGRTLRSEVNNFEK